MRVGIGKYIQGDIKGFLYHLSDGMPYKLGSIETDGDKFAGKVGAK